MNSPLLMAFLAVLELVALAYFVFVIWRAEGLATILLRGGYEAKGWTQDRLAARLRLLGIVGIAVAIGAVGLAMTKIIG